jgi:hypothetical protein
MRLCISQAVARISVRLEAFSALQDEVLTTEMDYPSIDVSELKIWMTSHEKDDALDAAAIQVGSAHAIAWMESVA